MTLVREVFYDAKTRESGERWVEMPGVLTAEQAAEADRLLAIHHANLAIMAEMDEADMRIMRAVCERDTARIEAHKAAQAERRARIKPVV